MKEKQKVTPNMKATKNESGKSMVEMLGVLALMGLLAILGAKGYNMAMERAMANEIINDVNKRSLLHSQQLLAGSALDVSEMPDKIRDIYPVSAEKLGVQFFTLKVSQVETPVCRRIADLGYTVPIQVTANGTKITPDNTTPCENQTGIVEMAFTFNRTLTPCPGCLDDLTTCENSGQCATNEVCQNGICQCTPQYSCAGVCCSAGQFCVNNQCVTTPTCGTDLDCEQGVCENGNCICRSYRDCDYFCNFSNAYTGVCSDQAYLMHGTGESADIIWSTTPLRWYAAKDFCLSQGKNMVSFSDLGCQSANTTSPCSIPAKFRNRGTVWVSNPPETGRAFWMINTQSGYLSNSYFGSASNTGKTNALCY